jgi:hypothetical protein
MNLTRALLGIVNSYRATSFASLTILRGRKILKYINYSP